MLLSIVIPVYKVEKFLEICLNSIIEQDGVTTDVYEIIAVDDGSPDRCPELLDDYAQRVPNMRVIHQANGGLSVARNTGLNAAKGEYVWFVDSDDWLAPGALKAVVNSLKHNPDVLQIGYMMAWPGRNEPVEVPHWEGFVSGMEAYRRNAVSAAAQFAVYKRRLLVEHGLQFMPGLLHEDLEFKPRVLYFADKFMNLPDSVYYYRQRETGSIMASFNIRNALHVIKGVNSLVEFIESKNATDSQKQVFGNQIGSSINVVVGRYKSFSPKERKTILQAMKQDTRCLRYMKLSWRLKYRMEALVLNLCLLCFGRKA